MWKKLFLFTVIIWIASPIQSAVLECNWDSQMQYCMVQNITPVTQQNEVITVKGQPNNYVNINVTSLWFYQQVINYVPTGLLTLFPNLQYLALSQYETMLLTTDSIPNCGQLTSFGADRGLITHIPTGVLQSCKSLGYLILRDNNITTVDIDAFKGLTNLTNLELSGNKISCIPSGLFQHTPLLSSIYLYNNLITAIDSNLFTNLPNLLGVHLGYNLLSYIPMLNFTRTAASSQSWLTIGLDSNPIYAFAPDFCSTFGARPADNLNINIYNISCISFNGSYYGISSSNCQNSTTGLQNCYANWTSSMNTSVPCGVQPPTTLPPTTAVVTTPSPTPGSCPSDKICRYFLDQYNRYTCILDGVDSVLTSISGNHLITFADVNVRRVIFTNSFLSRIPPILFQKFTSLEYLTVSNCSMSAINTNTFTACGNLKYFDASNNYITTVDGASFKSCAALEVIDLTGNKFDIVSGQLFVNNPNLKSVYINRPPAMVLI